LLEFCLTLATLALSQAPQNPITDFCRRFGQQTAVVDENLYIDGGYVNADPLSQYPQAVMSMEKFAQAGVQNTNTSQMPAFFTKI